MEMSRQRKWQLKMVAEGKCSQCGKYREDSPYKTRCKVCAKKTRDRRRLRTNSSPWRKGSRGVPPLMYDNYTIRVEE